MRPDYNQVGLLAFGFGHNGRGRFAPHNADVHPNHAGLLCCGAQAVQPLGAGHRADGGRIAWQPASGVFLRLAHVQQP